MLHSQFNYLACCFCSDWSILPPLFLLNLHLVLSGCPLLEGCPSIRRKVQESPHGWSSGVKFTDLSTSYSPQDLRRDERVAAAGRQTRQGRDWSSCARCSGGRQRRGWTRGRGGHSLWQRGEVLATAMGMQGRGGTGAGDRRQWSERLMRRGPRELAWEWDGLGSCTTARSRRPRLSPRLGRPLQTRERPRVWRPTALKDAAGRGRTLGGGASFVGDEGELRAFWIFFFLHLVF
jgi:hypothetical protein